MKLQISKGVKEQLTACQYNPSIFQKGLNLLHFRSARAKMSTGRRCSVTKKRGSSKKISNSSKKRHSVTKKSTNLKSKPSSATKKIVKSLSNAKKTTKRCRSYKK